MEDTTKLRTPTSAAATANATIDTTTNATEENNFNSSLSSSLPLMSEPNNNNNDSMLSLLQKEEETNMNMNIRKRECTYYNRFKHREKPKSKSTSLSSSFSLFSMFNNNSNNNTFSSVSPFHLRKMITMNDILDSNVNASTSTNISDIDIDTDNGRDETTIKSQTRDLLQKCNDADINDLLLGFDTTQSQIDQLGLLLHDQLLLECSSIIKLKHDDYDDYDDDNPSNQSKNQEEDDVGKIEVEGKNIKGNGSNSNNDDSCKSFLELHSKWMKVCVDDEECHSFAYILLRNVILSLQHCQYEKCDHLLQQQQQSCHIDITKRKMETMEIMIQMLVRYMKLSNDGTVFQTQWVQLLHILIEICFKKNPKHNNGHQNVSSSVTTATTTMATLMAYYDTNGTLFAQCLSILSSPFITQMLILESNLIPSLMHLLLSNDTIRSTTTITSNNNEGSLSQDDEVLILIQLLQKRNGDKDGNSGAEEVILDYLESTMTEYLLSLLRHVILHLYPHALSRINVTSVLDGRLVTLDNLDLFVLSLEENDTNSLKETQTMIKAGRDVHNDIENSVMSLMQPFYYLLDIGINPESCHLFNPTIGTICSDVTTHLILNGCSQNYDLLVKVTSQLQNLLETSIIIQNKMRDQIWDNNDDSENILSSSFIAIHELFQIHKTVLLHLPWNKYSQLDDWNNHRKFWENLFTLIVSCLHALLSTTTSRMGSIDLSSWNDSVAILLPILQMEQWRQFSIDKEEKILNFVCEYQKEVTKVGGNESTESMILIHCILFSFKKHAIVNENEKLFASNLTMHYWKSLLLSPTLPPLLRKTIQDFDSFLSLTYFQNDELCAHVTREELPFVSNQLKDSILSKILSQQIELMITS